MGPVNFVRHQVTDAPAGESSYRKMANNYIKGAQKTVSSRTDAALNLELSANQVCGGVDAGGFAIFA